MWSAAAMSWENKRKLTLFYTDSPWFTYILLFVFCVYDLSLWYRCLLAALNHQNSGKNSRNMPTLQQTKKCWATTDFLFPENCEPAHSFLVPFFTSFLCPWWFFNHGLVKKPYGWISWDKDNPTSLLMVELLLQENVLSRHARWR